jgi:hypothetical protein
MIKPVPVDQLSAKSIRAVATQLGYRLVTNFVWFAPDTKCGCAAGFAAVAVQPSLAGGVIVMAEMIPVLGDDMLNGLADGFEAEPKRTQFTPEYDRAFAIGTELRNFATDINGGRLK